MINFKEFSRLSLLLGIIITLGCSTPSQNKKLDGRVFIIESFVNNEKTGEEYLSFKDGMMEGSECVRYGFGEAVYQQNGSEFFLTMKSEDEGIMVWKGSVDGNVISGTTKWSKDGQDDIHLTFKGHETDVE